jgi:hypothetical protein
MNPALALLGDARGLLLDELYQRAAGRDESVRWSLASEDAVGVGAGGLTCLGRRIAVRAERGDTSARPCPNGQLAVGPGDSPTCVCFLTR